MENVIFVAQLFRLCHRAHRFHVVSELEMLSIINSLKGSSQMATSTMRSLTVLVRSYSMYQPFYIEPTYQPQKLQELVDSGEAVKRAFIPIKAARNDHNVSVFHDAVTNKFISIIMEKGKKELARSLVEETFARIKQIQLSKYHQAPTEAEKEEIELNPVVILHKAIENCQPILQLTPIKRGGTTYQVPIPVTAKRSNFLAMKWLMEESCNKDRKVHFPVKLANELIEAANNTGKVVKKKQDLHRQCEANRAYAHYRWG